MANVSEVDYFARLVEALEPWLDRVVIIGGWGTDCTAFILWRSHSIMNPWEPSMPMSPFPVICTRLASRSASGLLAREFREELMGDTNSPATYYRVQSGDNSFYAEFLTPFEGSAVKRGEALW